MRIKATINVEYDIDLTDYHLSKDCNREEAVQAIELHTLSKALTEALPWPPFTVDEAGNVTPDKQILEIKLELT